MASPAFPEPPPSIEPSAPADVDAALARLSERAPDWVALGIPERIALLERCIETVAAEADAWVEIACKAKGIPTNSQCAGEEWLAGPMTTQRNLRLLVETLKAGGQPKLPGTREGPGGRTIAQVFPTNIMDRVLFTGMSAEVWLEPGKPATQGHIYREKAAGRPPAGGVSLVLGAGNVASIGPMDAFYKLFVEDEVVIIKMNPVNEYLGPVFERALKPLIDEGFLAIAYGGAEIGGYLCHHDAVKSVHITGSDRTHDAIVWGRSEEQERRKAADDPVLKKPISSELGCVTPVLVVPGPWTDAQLEYQARHIAGMVSNNGSFNCNAAKVILLAKGWDQKQAFLDKLRSVFSRLPARKAYYPGAQDRYQRFLDTYPQATPMGDRSKDVVPWTLIPDVPAEAGEYALTNEAFCGILSLVEIDVETPEAYLSQAVDFANDSVWGTLSCVILIDPKTERQNKAAFESAVERLRYGGIGVNVWAGVIYGLVVTTWGAYPGHSLKEIISGRGVVHNTFLLDHPEKSVVRAPFVIKPTPAWFADNKNLTELGRRMTALESDASWLKVPSVAIAAFKG